MGKKVWIVLIILVLLIASAGAYVYVNYFSAGEPEIVRAGSGNSVPAPILTKETLPAYFEQQALVKALPNEAVIALDFFEIKDGEWVVVDSYTLKRGSVTVGEASNPDLVITVASKYLPQFGDFCKATKNAKANGDIAFDMKLSITSMMWKYKSVMKYRECFGF